MISGEAGEMAAKESKQTSTYVVVGVRMLGMHSKLIPNVILYNRIFTSEDAAK